MKLRVAVPGDNVLEGLWTPPTKMSNTTPHFYRTQVNLGSDLWVRMSVSPRGCRDLTDVTLADKDTNSILTDI